MTNRKIVSDPVFTRLVRTRGKLGVNYVFTSQKEVEGWIKTTLPLLQKKYAGLQVEVESLPGLKVGDSCFVWGEADDLFVVQKLVKYEEHRYGFLLTGPNGGTSEEVAKCYCS